MKRWARAVLVLLVASFSLTPLRPVQAAYPPETEKPTASDQTSVILFIGDGMGFEHVKAGGYYLNGEAGSLVFESFPYQAEMTTCSASSSITDSAAAATAMATGFKVNNGVISLNLPGDGSELKTLLETARDRGQSTGLVSTTHITHATPAGFGAHSSSRSNTTEIASDYLTSSRPNVLLGGGGAGMSAESAQAAGYQVVIDQAQLFAVDTETVTHLSGQFGSGAMPYELAGTGNLPHLSEMTATALNVLDNNPAGFFLMVEGGLIDFGSHANRIDIAALEVVEFSRAVQVALDWAANHPNTLILVLADHETGGLTITQNNDQGQFPSATWSTTGHTAANVPVYAWGVNANRISGVMDNTQVPAFVESLAVTQPVEPPIDPLFSIYLPLVVSQAVNCQ